MKTKKRFVIEYFLRVLHLKGLSEKEPKHLDPVFLKGYNNVELRAMVKFISGKDSSEPLNLGDVNEDEMYNALLDEHPEIGHALCELADGLKEYNNITDEKIAATFAKLEMESHYLQAKPQAD